MRICHEPLLQVLLDMKNGLNAVHVNLVGIQTWEEPTKAPGAVMGSSNSGHKGRGVIWLPV